MLAFVNDGNGHFALSTNIFADNTFPCVQGGRSWLADEFDTLHPCGNQQDYTNGKIVADFNGDGISDYYDTPSAKEECHVQRRQSSWFDR